jgi:hypothetical protein
MKGSKSLATLRYRQDFRTMFIVVLQHCEWPDQWHFQYQMCMNDDDVSCWVQMEKYYHGHNYDKPSSNSLTGLIRICFFFNCYVLFIYFVCLLVIMLMWTDKLSVKANDGNGH